MDMKAWVAEQIAAEKKTPFPVVSFPVIQLMGIGLNDFILNSELQAEGMVRVVQELDLPGAISPMDLSVEAEAFGAKVKFFEEEIPAVVGKLVEDEEAAATLSIPPVGAARTAVNLKAVELVKARLHGKPVFAGTIGPFSLAGRLMGVSDAVSGVRRKPNMVRILLEKATEFLIEYIREYNRRGADGVFIAEPLAGLLAPQLAAQFSHTYMKCIIEAVQNDEFAVIYHNCGNSVAHMVEAITEMDAMCYHFGNAIDITAAVPKVPTQCLVMGNLDPSGVVKNGAAEDVYKGSLNLLRENGSHPNFVLSTGCDIPPAASWDNIRAMCRAAQSYYG